MHGVLVGTVLLTSFVAGLVALLAPCCVSVMLPAYLATGLGRRSGVLGATLVFAAGVATVIVPIGVGATALSALVAGHHFAVFSLGGLAMTGGGLAVLAGWRPRLPLPMGRAAGGRGGVGPVYLLGVFSGAASSCCAPVLAGIAVLSGAAGSFPVAVAVSLTYVAGMVAPLALLAVLWERRDWSSSRLLHGRDVTVPLLRQRRITLGTLASGLLLVGMGLLTVLIAFTGPGMGNGGWRIRVAADLQHAAAVTTRLLSWLPGWAFLLLLTAAAVLVVREVRRRPASRPGHPGEALPDAETGEAGSARLTPLDPALEPSRRSQP
ncbi:MAG: cytochrome c biogenesis protein CcdA [Candidatus Dormibacteraeota bacterium]|nr:cytochrome c biogenesis protein CcdA [Candidatus Dormibacteraeota bacterium]